MSGERFGCLMLVILAVVWMLCTTAISIAGGSVNG